MITFIALVRAWFGEEEYHEAWYKQPRMKGFAFRFWGRLILCFAGLCFFAWQQISAPSQWWRSDAIATFIVVLTMSQAAGPLFYLLWTVTKKEFLTEDYLATLKAGRFYISVKSTIGIVLMGAISSLAASGLLGTHWYIKPLAFFLTVPVAYFWVFLPAFNWVRVKVSRQNA